MVVAVISDTHLPRGRRRLPDACRQRLAAADLILHAGDLIEIGVLRELEALGEVAAVHGNVDEPAVRMALPARRVVEAAGARIGMLHDADPAKGRLERLRGAFPATDAVVFGHSHVPLHERARDGFQIFNPGSPTDRRRQPRHTMGEARLGEEGLRFTLIALE